MMRDILKGDQNAQSNQEHEHSHSNQRLKTHCNAPFVIVALMVALAAG
jgi:hypothetical protein